jgi:uncharacterized small protein (DUF1192 family)
VRHDQLWKSVLVPLLQGLASLHDVLALSITELAERVELLKKQRRKLEVLMKQQVNSRRAGEL